ncbi:MAG: ROK family protein [Bacillota bacterium]
MDNVQVGNSQYIRDLNLSGIFRLIHKYGPVSRKELADNTGYSAATISNHVKRLLDYKFVIETEKGSSTGGRKPVYLSVNSARNYIISVEFEINDIKLMIFDLNMDVKAREILPLEKENPEQVILDLIESIKCFIKDSGIDIKKVIGMGIAVPGLVNNEEGLLYLAPNLDWNNVPIKKYFLGEFHFPILLENEAKAAVIGEREFIYPEAENIVFVSINEGIGCGIVFEGSLYRGASGNAGEFGHIIVDSDGPECHCGNHGCWETLASLNYITTEYYKKTGINITAKQFQEILSKDKESLLPLFIEVGRNIGVGLANIINSLSPELLVIGGNVLNIKEYVRDNIKDVMDKKTLGIPYNKVKIEYSKLENKASLYGIARMVFDYYIEEEIFKVV